MNLIQNGRIVGEVATPKTSATSTPKGQTIPESIRKTAIHIIFPERNIKK